MLCVGYAHERNLVELMFYGPDRVVHRSFDDEVHPAIQKERRRCSFRARRTRVIVRIELLEIDSQLLQQLAAVAVLFKFLQPVPSDVECCIARDDIADETFSRLPIGKKTGY